MTHRGNDVRARVGLAIALLFNLAGAAVAETPRETFQRLINAGLQAEKAGDFKGAEAEFAKADAITPNYPPLMMERARAAARGHDADAAIALLSRYADAGLKADAAYLGPDLQALADDPRFKPVRERLDRNAAPVGHPLPAASLGDGPFLAENVAWDQARNRFLVSSVWRHTIVAVDEAGAASPYLQPGAPDWSIFNLGVDARRGVLWASASASGPGGPEGDKTSVALLEIDLASGRVMERFSPPIGGARQRSFGDLVVTRDGTVYVSDSLAGEVWRLKPGAQGLDRLVAPGVMDSPQGLVPTPDGRRLIVSDYPGGLFSVEIATGRVERLPAPKEASLIWLDGMVGDGTGGIIAVQSTSRPERVLRLTLDRDWRRVTGWTVLAANLPELRGPTGGIVRGREFVFVARSQWDDFDDDGKPKTDKPEPALIERLPLG
ncbi:MAG: SMP-30/gluconolactonase/LRE family protein [Proteobacteria bacterium]|nr:SMP-30/gluconolactonase/LRE family protein [Pseudomonadota bacterium]